MHRDNLHMATSVLAPSKDVSGDADKLLTIYIDKQVLNL
jgi:hypothetical protein